LRHRFGNAEQETTIFHTQVEMARQQTDTCPQKISNSVVEEIRRFASASSRVKP
jgi:hypothetical protein